MCVRDLALRTRVCVPSSQAFFRYTNGRLRRLENPMSLHGYVALRGDLEGVDRLWEAALYDLPPPPPPRCHAQLWAVHGPDRVYTLMCQRWAVHVG